MHLSGSAVGMAVCGKQAVGATVCWITNILLTKGPTVSDRKIMVIDRSTLFSDGYFQGYSPAEEIDYESIIQENYFYDLRDKVETMPQYKQPIAYAVIVHKPTLEIFTYQRASKDRHYKEKRLQGKWSWGIGGHIDKIDVEKEDPIRASLVRELSEEIHITTYDTPQILGYINDDLTEVGQVHFGLLYLIFTADRKIRPRDGEISWGGFMPISQLQEICENEEASVESWSEIALIPLREHLGIDLE